MKACAATACSMAERFTVIILAAQRDGRLDRLSAAAGGRPKSLCTPPPPQAGRVNPLAAGAGVSHKCLVPIGGRPLLAHVLAALAEVDGVEAIRISVEPGADTMLAPIAV